MSRRIGKFISLFMVCIMLCSMCANHSVAFAKTLEESVTQTVAFGEYDTVKLSMNEITTLKIVMTEKGTFQIDFSPKDVSSLWGQLYDENGNELCYTTGGVGRGACYAKVLTLSNFRTVGSTGRETNASELEPGTYYLKLWTENSSVAGTYTFFARQKASSSVSIEMSIVLQKGKSVQLGTIITNSTDKNVKWSSSKKSIATVSSTGKVKGLKKGTTTIKAYTSSGLVVKIKVKVK